MGYQTCAFSLSCSPAVQQKHPDLLHATRRTMQSCNHRTTSLTTSRPCDILRLKDSLPLHTITAFDSLHILYVHTAELVHMCTLGPAVLHSCIHTSSFHTCCVSPAPRLRSFLSSSKDQHALILLAAYFSLSFPASFFYLYPNSLLACFLSPLTSISNIIASSHVPCP